MDTDLPPKNKIKLEICAQARALQVNSMFL